MKYFRFGPIGSKLVLIEALWVGPKISKLMDSTFYWNEQIVLAKARLTLQKKQQPKNDIDIRKVLMLVHLFPKYFEIIFLSSVCGSVWTRWPPKRSNPRFGLIFLVLKLASRHFRVLLDIFYWLQCIFQILRFLHLAKNRPNLVFFYDSWLQPY